MANLSATRTGAIAVATVEKQRRALELRKDGATLQAIADALGYASPTGARKAITTALAKITQEPAEEVRTLELARLDAMLFAISPQVRNGHLGAIDRALRIMERRAKLIGLDQPTKIDVRRVVAEMSDLYGLTVAESEALHADVASFLAEQKAGAS